MKITWLGHACFAAESDGYRIVFDPYTMEVYPPLYTSAHEILCSHGHRDHNYVEAVELLAKRKSPFTVCEVESFHDDQEGAARGTNRIHIAEAEGIRVVHLGDLGHELSAEQIAAVGRCDVLMIPVGGFYTIDAAAAKKVADSLRAKIVVPMHYRHGEYGLRVVGEVEEFLALCEGMEIKKLEGNSFEVAPASPAGVIVPNFVH